jgi:hypothetical protein
LSRPELHESQIGVLWVIWVIDNVEHHTSLSEMIGRNDGVMVTISLSDDFCKSHDDNRILGRVEGIGINEEMVANPIVVLRNVSIVRARITIVARVLPVVWCYGSPTEQIGSGGSKGT